MEAIGFVEQIYEIVTIILEADDCMSAMKLFITLIVLIHSLDFNRILVRLNGFQSVSFFKVSNNNLFIYA